ncbi:protein-export chaperone SecB [Sphingomonas montanisoli]|uniref:Protein-export protein SecB n=1 Tax=Sphingomonas montanisoli TaxID=2606412 RepID=A0A5D9C9L4_9SPHN|nr:protein-export chaperone SecB [Sphingomonas montanisoli]TZG27842.1 protein-export chaperone SecB [Sphingomonas montanisoli]
MADEQGTDQGAEATIPNGIDNEPQVMMIAQYVKDLSFENPNSPSIYQAPEQPKIDVQFNIGSQQAAEDVFEVALKIEVSATFDETLGYAVELVYAGLFGLRNIPAEQIQAFLFAEAPRLLFPFARRVVADAIRDGNFSPLVLEPIDFGTLYLQQAAQQAELANAQPAGEA